MTKPAFKVALINPPCINLFDELRAAYARRDPNAKTMRKQLAHELFLRGQQSVAFCTLLLIEAEHARSRGQWSRAEALGRLAVLISDDLGADPRDTKGALRRTYRARTRLDPALLHVGVPGGIVMQIDAVTALMRLHLSTLDYVPSPPHLIQIWILIRDRDQCGEVIEGILADMNRRLAEQNAWDSNYTAVRAYQMASVSAAELIGLKQRGQLAVAPLYLPSALFIADSGRYAPASVDRFVELTKTTP